MQRTLKPLAENTIDVLKSVSTATITSQLRKRGIRNVLIVGAKPLNSTPRTFAGEAFTLRFIPMREDLSQGDVLSNPDYPPRKAIETVPPGHVLVVDCRGDVRAGVLGDILALRLQVRGVAAVVSDGPMRDVRELREMDLPIYCNGAAAPPTLTAHFGADLGCAIGCGGVAVMQGDVLAGDEDGVVVVPRDLADEVARDSREQEDLEVYLKSRIAEGNSIVGVYPPSEEILAAYRRERDTKK
ncbi:MAG: ribonuclease activity regulator RraA [Rhizobiaceae bacterium]|nr:ribonuclease activity regulator RraA [Rhizobiaceae bacterium]